MYIVKLSFINFSLLLSIFYNFYPPLPTFGLRSLAKSHLGLLRESQVLLLESSQEGPESGIGTTNQLLKTVVPTIDKIVRMG